MRIARRYMHGRRRRKSPLKAVGGEDLDVQQEEALQDWEKAKTVNSNTAKDKVAAEGREGIQKVQIVGDENTLTNDENAKDQKETGKPENSAREKIEEVRGKLKGNSWWNRMFG